MTLFLKCLYSAPWLCLNSGMGIASDEAREVERAEVPSCGENVYQENSTSHTVQKVVMYGSDCSFKCTMTYGQITSNLDLNVCVCVTF